MEKKFQKLFIEMYEILKNSKLYYKNITKTQKMLKNKRKNKNNSKKRRILKGVGEY